MASDAATEPQMVNLEQQEANVRLIRSYFEQYNKDETTRSSGMPYKTDRWEKYFSPKVRLWIDSRPSDNPVVFRDDEVFIGFEAMQEIDEKFARFGFWYNIEIHAVFACGPLVIATRTDTRKETGKPDKPVPSVGVFAVRDGKIIEWSDYYR